MKIVVAVKDMQIVLIAKRLAGVFFREAGVVIRQLPAHQRVEAVAERSLASQRSGRRVGDAVAARVRGVLQEAADRDLVVVKSFLCLHCGTEEKYAQRNDSGPQPITR